MSLKSFDVLVEALEVAGLIMTMYRRNDLVKDSNTFDMEYGDLGGYVTSSATVV